MMRGCAWDRERERRERKNEEQNSLSEKSSLSVPPRRPLHAHTFCPPSLRVATLISIPCPHPFFSSPASSSSSSTVAASVCNFDPMYLRVSSFHGSCKKGGVDTCALCGLKNESQYVHDKIYIYMCVRRNVVPLLPFVRLYILFLRPVSRGKSERGEERRVLWPFLCGAPGAPSRLYVVASFSAGICNTDGGSDVPDTTSSSSSSMLAISQHDKSFQPAPASIPFLFSSLPFPSLCPRVYTCTNLVSSLPYLSQSLLLLLFFSFFLLLAGIGRMVTRRRRDRGGGRRFYPEQLEFA